MKMIRAEKWQRGPNIIGDDPEDTSLLRNMYVNAQKYLIGFDWAPPIKDIFLAFGVGGVIALFLVEFAHSIGGQDDELWVVVGDLPCAYFVTDDANDPASALLVYCELMSGWVEAVLSSESLADVFPVSDPPTRGNAEALRKRIDYIKADIIPTI